MANIQNLKPCKPGETHNPNGRPKGKKNIKTMLVELLSAQDPDGEWAKLPAAQLVRSAFKDGNFRALVEILDRIEGKAVTEHRGDPVTSISNSLFIQSVVQKAKELQEESVANRRFETDDKAEPSQL
jgi:hypothetical protein